MASALPLQIQDYGTSCWQLADKLQVCRQTIPCWQGGRKGRTAEFVQPDDRSDASSWPDRGAQFASFTFSIR